VIKPFLLLYNILLANNLYYPLFYFETVTLEHRLGKPMYIKVREYLNSPLLKKHYIIIWEDLGKITRESLRLSSRGLTKAEEDSVILFQREEGVEVRQIATEERVAGIGYDTTAYLLEGKVIKEEFNKMVKKESLSVDSYDKAIELAKLYIRCAMKGEKSARWGFLEELDDFESFFKRYKDRHIWYFREYPFIKSLKIPARLFNIDSLHYYDLHPELRKQYARSEEEIEKLIREDAKISFKEMNKLFQKNKPPSKIWFENSGYVVQICTYDWLKRILRWQIKLINDGTIRKASARERLGICLLGCWF